MTDWKERFSVDELTPVEMHCGVLFKRDDLYVPFSDIPLSGGKVRQAISLMGLNQDRIANECNGRVYTSTNIDSPQGIIVTRAAKAFGFENTIFIGHTKMESLLKKPLMKNAVNFGAKVHICKAPWDRNIESEIRKLGETERFFHVKFGINISGDRQSILETTADQARNLPPDLDVLIVPCGSAITFSGILLGLKKWSIRPKRIIGIQISGKDLADYPRSVLDYECFPYEFCVSRDWDYHRRVKVRIDDGFVLDPIYEAKAWDWMQKNLMDSLAGKKVCFWCVGSSIAVRDGIYEPEAVAE